VSKLPPSRADSNEGKTAAYSEIILVPTEHTRNDESQAPGGELITGAGGMITVVHAHGKLS